MISQNRFNDIKNKGFIVKRHLIVYGPKLISFAFIHCLLLNNIRCKTMIFQSATISLFFIYFFKRVLDVCRYCSNWRVLSTTINDVIHIYYITETILVIPWRNYFFLEQINVSLRTLSRHKTCVELCKTY